MTHEHELYSQILMTWLLAGVASFVVLQFLVAPYGRHRKPGWGPTIHRTAGWVIMESPAVFVFLACYLISDRRSDPVSIAFLLLWLLHYVNRAFVYPFRLRGGELRIPLSIVAMAFGFNLVNGYLQGRGLFTIGPVHAVTWFFDPRFIIGLLMFIGGYTLNRQSDSILRALRAPGDTGYRIPYSSEFRLVSCPNYLGELIEWLGWALLTWSLTGFGFFLWTAANLIPRARAHHRWYRAQFPNYPADRKAVIPFLY